MFVSILCIENLVATLAVISLINTHVSTFVLLGEVTVLMINIFWVTSEATITVARVRTTSSAPLTSATSRVRSITIIVISTVGAVISRWQAALVLGVLSTKGNVPTLAGV